MRTSVPTALLALIVALGPWRPAGAADAFVPSDDSLVLERLPRPPSDPTERQLRALRADLARRPDNLELAVRVAWSCIAQGRALSDPRYYGHAQAALTPWWSAPDPPVPVLVLRATIRQHDHDFDGALADLALALRADPDNAQAWLTQAMVQLVRGEYAAARRSCLEVLPRANPLVAVTCIGTADSLSGDARGGYERLRHAFARQRDADAETRKWTLTVLAEIAARRAQPEQADAHFRQALAVARPDDYLFGAYADFLLDQGRPAAVRELLRAAPRTDAVLLRLALADAMSAKRASADARELQARFEAARWRGDTVHRREEARFALGVLHDAPTALALARDNWAVQREPWDARILVDAARAAEDDAAAQPVLRFIADTGLEDAMVARSAARLQAARR